MTSARYVLEILQRLRTIRPESLRQLLSARSIPVSSDWRAIDLAEALSQPAAIVSHLEQLTAEELHALRSGLTSEGSGDRDHALDSLLVSEISGELCVAPEVAAVWGELEAAHLNTRQKRHRPPRRGGGVDLTRVGQYLEWLETIALSAGSVSQERAGESLMSRREEADAALSCAIRVGLVVSQAGRLWLSSWGAWWMTEDLASRWSSVVERWWALSPRWWQVGAQENHNLPDSKTVGSWVADRYPLLTPARVEDILDQAEGLGILYADELTSIGHALATQGDVAEAILLALPETIDSVLPDGPDTVIAAGRLQPAVERSLRQVGTWLSGVLAPRFRITPASAIFALQAGWSKDSILDALHLALPGGSAQTMIHDVSHALNTADSLKLSPKGSLCELTSDDPVTLSVIAADYHLAHLGWQTQGKTLASNRPLSEVDAALTAAGYWHLVTDSRGSLRAPGSRWQCLGGATDENFAASIDSLAQSLAQQASTPLWWDHALQLAVARKVSLKVGVSVGAETKVFSVEPMGIGNGRFRARDVRAEVERTIPLDQIRAIQPG